MLTGTTPEWLRWMFSRIARRYDLANTVISGGLDGLWRRRLAQRVAQRAPRQVLDVACGTAGVIRHMARRCAPATQFLGVDFTEAMLRVGQRRLAAGRWPQPLYLCVGDAHALPCASERFDVVTMMFGVRNFAVPAGGLAECYRVLRPGGYVCLVEFDWPRGRGLQALYSAYFRYVLPLIAWPLSGERSAYRYLRDSVLAFRPQANLIPVLQQVGFQEVDAMPLSGGMTVLYEGRKPL